MLFLWASKAKRVFSRTGARAQSKTLETRQRFAPLREKIFFAEPNPTNHHETRRAEVHSR